MRTTYASRHAKREGERDGRVVTRISQIVARIDRLSAMVGSQSHNMSDVVKQYILPQLLSPPRVLEYEVHFEVDDSSKVVCIVQPCLRNNILEYDLRCATSHFINIQGPHDQKIEFLCGFQPSVLVGRILDLLNLDVRSLPKSNLRTNIRATMWRKNPTTFYHEAEGRFMAEPMIEQYIAMSDRVRNHLVDDVLQWLRTIHAIGISAHSIRYVTIPSAW